MGRKKNYNGTPEQRFWRKVDVPSADECWEWTGAKRSDGYGIINIDGKLVSAHRWSYKKYRGEIPDGMFVCHKCDVRLCVRPDHLFLGTHADNVADMMQKGRQNKGEVHGMSKLSNSDVTAIKKRLAAGRELQKDIGADYGVTQARISEINTGKGWAHVEVAA